jgi:hypothetical protein
MAPRDPLFKATGTVQAYDSAILAPEPCLRNASRRARPKYPL